jgi:hypothetical protein
MTKDIPTPTERKAQAIKDAIDRLERLLKHTEKWEKESYVRKNI